MDVYEQGHNQRSRHWLVAGAFVGIVAVGGVFVGSLAERRATGTERQATPNNGVIPTTLMPTAEIVPTASEVCTSKLSLNFLVGQTLMIGLNADAMASQTPLFKEFDVGGGLLMTAPANPYDGSIKRFKIDGSGSKDHVLVSTDEEGGLPQDGGVQRFTNLGVLPTPAEVAATETPSQAKAMIAAHGRKLKAVGIDMVFAPLADVAPINGESPLGNRVFSSNPAVVREYAQAYAEGWRASHIIPTYKHFPGMGSATGNTDYGAATTPPFSSLVKRDFVPYRGMASSNVAVMVGNPNTVGWYQGPASESPKVDAYLRDNLGYANNLVITDALNATAVTASGRTVTEAVVYAIKAGNDMATVVEGTNNYSINKDEIEGFVNALKAAVRSGRIPKRQLEASVDRVLAAKDVNACALVPADA